jgi:hypothetical protein
MLTLSRKQMMVLVLFFVSFIVTLIASMAIIHAINPGAWQQVLSKLPDIISYYN